MWQETVAGPLFGIVGSVTPTDALHTRYEASVVPAVASVIASSISGVPNDE
jgi:hypothetical protein